MLVFADIPYSLKMLPPIPEEEVLASHCWLKQPGKTSLPDLMNI